MTKTQISNVSELKETLLARRQNNESKEFVPDEKAIAAKANIKTMAINNIQDMFLFYASLNLLNTYVKQNKRSKHDYDFKKYVNFGLESVLANGGMKDVSFDIDNKEGTTLVNVAGVQFSFHYVMRSQALELAMRTKHPMYKPQQWEGLRLQQSADTIFDWASNLEGLSNECSVGDLDKFRKEQIEQFRLESQANQFE